MLINSCQKYLCNVNTLKLRLSFNGWFIITVILCSFLWNWRILSFRVCSTWFFKNYRPMHFCRCSYYGPLVTRESCKEFIPTTHKNLVIKCNCDTAWVETWLDSDEFNTNDMFSVTYRKLVSNLRKTSACQTLKVSSLVLIIF